MGVVKVVLIAADDLSEVLLGHQAFSLHLLEHLAPSLMAALERSNLVEAERLRTIGCRGLRVRAMFWLPGDRSLKLPEPLDFVSANAALAISMSPAAKAKLSLRFIISASSCDSVRSSTPLYRPATSAPSACS